MHILARIFAPARIILQQQKWVGPMGPWAHGPNGPMGPTQPLKFYCSQLFLCDKPFVWKTATG